MPDRLIAPAFLLSLGLLAGCASVQATPPIKSGTYVFAQKDAEHPDMPGGRFAVEIEGDHIRVLNRAEAGVYPKGLIEEGTLLWHAASGQWIIGERGLDENAAEVGGCSDGPTVVDLEKKIYWTC